jgi:tetratricopeptide (TPR) repeat protein
VYDGLASRQAITLGVPGMLHQAISVSLLSAMAALSPASSQGIPRNASISGNAPYVVPATRVLVATPYPSSPGDSMAAVALGNAIRDRLANKIGGSEWAVITRLEVNRNLQTWGYGADQVFAPESAKLLASKMTAQVFVMTTLSKTLSGVFTASIRVTGLNDDAGQVVQATQVAGQALADYGSKIADQVAVIFKAYPDAKFCNDDLAADKSKAVDGANRALKVMPNYGNAEYCLGLIEQAKDPVGPETLRHFKNATIGDPFSLKAVNQLRIIHEKKHDSTAVVADYQQMMTIAPTNTLLADEAVKKFKTYGRPDAAEQVVAQQIKLDPTNPDWLDLLGNSCAAQAAGEPDAAKAKVKFACAYTAFVQEFTLDPTRADTNFFPKIVFVAGNRSDSSLWAKRWADKYSSSTDPYDVQLSIYLDAGQVDSALTVVNLLARIDPTDSKPALAMNMALLKAKRYDDAIKLASFVQKNGDEAAKNQYAGLLVTFADSESRRTPHDDSTLVHIGKALIAFNAPNKLYTEYGHYFTVLGISPEFTTLSKAARADKSCDTVKRYETFVAVLDSSVQVLVASSNANLAVYGKQVSDIITGEKAFFPTLEKAFCKP